jgi:hypothetical protein
MANVFVEESHLESIAESIRLKFDGAVEVYFPSEMADNILGLPFANIPSYHRAEAGRVIKRLLELKALYPNNVVFGTISDNHVDKDTASTMTSARHAVYALETVGSMVCDFVVNLGDNVSGTNIDNDTDYADAVYMENASRYAMVELESCNLVGNHCKSNSTQKIYDLIGKHNSFDNYGTTKIRGYGYKDYADKKVRVICLNTCDYWNNQGGNGMSYEQKDFLMRALDLTSKSNFASWTIIILSHIPLDFLGGDYNKGADLKTILKAYNDGTTATITVNSNYASKQNENNKYSGTLSYNYAGKNSPKIINIHGHIHTNAYGKLTFIDDDTELNIYRIATPNSSFNGNASTDRYTDNGNYSITTAEANKIKKVANSKADTSATFYFIDLDGQVIYAVGYGADIDRTIPYKDVAVYVVTYNLTDIVSSNSSVTAIEGESFTTTLNVVGNDYAIDSVTVTMGGVDITATAYANGVVSIAEVTGSIIITATAVDNYIPVWDISSRRAVTDMYKGPNDTAEISRHNYYYGAVGTGAIYYNCITACSVHENNVTFTSNEKNTGIGVPYHLESGANYTFKSTASVKSRLRKVVLDANGVFVSGSEQYSGSGTDLTLTFTAPTDETQWVMLIFDAYTANESVTHSNISLTKN